jgi:hypothetical protein
MCRLLHRWSVLFASGKLTVLPNRAIFKSVSASAMNSSYLARTVRCTWPIPKQSPDESCSNAFVCQIPTPIEIMANFGDFAANHAVFGKSQQPGKKISCICCGLADSSIRQLAFFSKGNSVFGHDGLMTAGLLSDPRIATAKDKRPRW